MEKMLTKVILACGIIFLLTANPLGFNLAKETFVNEYVSVSLGKNFDKDCENEYNGMRDDERTLRHLQTPEGTRQVFKPQTCDPSQQYLPMLMEPGKHTRANGDLLFDLEDRTYADMTQDPDPVFFSLYTDDQGNQDIAWGSKGVPITYTPSIKNDGDTSINSYVVRLEIHKAIADPEGGWTISGVTPAINITQDLGPLQSGQIQAASLSWTPQFSGRFRILLSIEYDLDPDTSNNVWGDWPYVLSDWNTVETVDEQEKWDSGAGWSLANKPHVDDEHTPSHFWEHDTVGQGDLIYPFNTDVFIENELPFWGYDPEPGTRGFFVMWWFSSGSPLSNWDFQYWNATSGAYDSSQEGASPISDHWYTYGYGSMDQEGFRLQGTYLDHHYCSPQFKVKITGTNLYIDDLWILGLERAGPPTPEFSFDFKLKDGITYLDEWPEAGGNEIYDESNDPGASQKWNFTLVNTAPNDTIDIDGTSYTLGASIDSVSFDVDAPVGWPIPSPVSTTRADLSPGEFQHYEMTVSIPKDAPAGNYSIKVIATVSPKASTLPDQPNPLPSGPMSKVVMVESVVNKIPNLELTTKLNESHIELDEDTGEYNGAEYTVMVKNTANFASNILVELDSKPETDLRSYWTMEIEGGNHVELEDMASGEERIITVKIEVPEDENAGEFVSTIKAYITDYSSDCRTLELKTIIEQHFKLEDVTMTPGDVILDPSVVKGRTEKVKINVRNIGNGEDQIYFEVKSKRSEEKNWIGQEEGMSFTEGISPIIIEPSEEEDIEVVV